jgi:hypothetical protein
MVKARVANPVMKAMADALGITGLHVFKHAQKWMRGYLREFIVDSINAPGVKGYFDTAITGRLVDQFIAGEESGAYPTVGFALDLALAHKNFIQK